jgi:2-amino-4-hydroxy-6-hydroxymethyldihydropteridine diphosphokinase
VIIYLGLGSNVGDRLRSLNAAVDKLAATDGIDLLERSSVYETEPVGEVTDQPDFYNAAVKIETSLAPRVLLARCKQIEVDLGREPDVPRHGPRAIDIDLLLAEDTALHEGGLELPHPEVARRRFVLVPLLELDPELALPDGDRLEEALRKLGAGQHVERVAELHGSRA